MTRFAVDVDSLNLEEDLALEEMMAKSDHTAHQHTRSVIDDAPHVEKVQEACPDLCATECAVATREIHALIQQMQQDALNGIVKMPSNTSSSPVHPVRQKIRDVRVYCNFLASHGKKCSFNVRLKDAGVRGVDVVESSIKTFMSSDEKLRAMYSDNPRHYRLFMADDNTGDEEAPIQLDSSCANFSCLSLAPLPVAQLFLFLSRTALLPTPADDVSIVVEFRDCGKLSRRTVAVPLDLSIGKLEAFLSQKLTNGIIEQGTMRIRYGPLELSLSEKYNFGSGCGCPDVVVSEWTVLSLTKFGVSEVVVSGKIVEDEFITSAEGNLDHLKRMDEEEARAYQQFDVIKINKFGVKQQRVIGVDGERVYNMRPLSEVGKTKNPERLIEDVEIIRDFRDRPTYCEIEYNKASKYDTDRIECRNAVDCIQLVEKLRMLKRIHSRRQDMKRSDTTLSRFFNRLGFGK